MLISFFSFFYFNYSTPEEAVKGWLAGGETLNKFSIINFQFSLNSQFYNFQTAILIEN